MLDVLELEAACIKEASQKISEQDVGKLIKIYERLIELGGNLIFCGVGKSGVIAKKLASTYSSLGLSSFFLHPVEALHGDLGRVKSNDAIVFLSKSGTTEEILKLIPFIPIHKEMRVGLFGNSDSVLKDQVGIFFDCSVKKEACINNQAPTTSSTTALAMGDAMAVVYEAFVGLSKDRFAANHPGGLLGKSMLMKVKDLMVHEAQCPIVIKDATLRDVILEMTKFPVGSCAVLNSNKEMIGIIVEGDIRRALATDEKALSFKVEKIMTVSALKVNPDVLAHEALRIMEHRERPISHLPVIDSKNIFLGFVRLHDLLKEGFA